MAEHTPGPWYWEDFKGSTYLLGGGRRTIILDDACCNPQDDALIAAAPDLLAACRSAYSRLIQASMADPESEFFKQAIYEIEAALAKAEGRQ